MEDVITFAAYYYAVIEASIEKWPVAIEGTMKVSKGPQD